MTQAASRQVFRHAELHRLLAPKSIAILGASPNPKSFGARLLGNLTHFKGSIHLVNAKYDKIGDRACVPSLAAIPQSPDCVVIAMPRETVEAALLECAAAKVGGVIVFASGFAETGDAEHVALQARLSAIAAEKGVRMIGPNCIGIINYLNGAAATFAASAKYGFVDGMDNPELRRIGLVSQSGGVGFSLSLAAQRGVSFSHVLTSGNSGDVDVADYVSYLADDPGCHAIACLFEGMPDPLRFMEAARIAWDAGKPLVVHKIATGESGAAAAMSHTGMLAGSNAAYNAMFERAGVVTVDTLEALIETTTFFAKAPRLKSKGVAVSTSSGGLAVMSADKAEAHAVPLPQPNDTIQKVLAGLIPEFGSARNPCDVTAAIANNPAMLAAAGDAFLGDDAYGALVITHPLPWDVGMRIPALNDLAKRHGKLVCSLWTSEWLEGPHSRELEASPHTVTFRSMDRCFAAIAAWHRREDKLAAMQRSGPREMARVSPADAAQQAAKLIDASGNKTLTEREAKEVLAAYGVPVVGEKLVQSADEAATAATALGFPVALKVESPDLPHKTEAGVIRLGRKNEAEVKAAFEAVMANANKVSPKPRLNGVLVQPMISAGTEIMVGARIDPLFGPLIVAGLGGILVELLKDTSVDLAPVNHADARGMLSRLKAQAMLTGFRGSEPVDQDKLADIICRLSEFATDQKDRIAELDVNPLICSGGRIVAVDALIVKA